MNMKYCYACVIEISHLRRAWALVVDGTLPEIHLCEDCKERLESYKKGKVLVGEGFSG